VLLLTSDEAISLPCTNSAEILQLLENLLTFTQCKEIAEKPLAGGSISLLAKLGDDGMIRSAKGFSSGMQQCLADLTLPTPYAVPRNDEE
jgi:hypothetical protein